MDLLRNRICNVRERLWAQLCLLGENLAKEAKKVRLKWTPTSKDCRGEKASVLSFPLLAGP